MPDAPATRQSLLLRLRDWQDQRAWSQFVELYAPMIYAYLRKRGVQDADAADLAQTCLRKVSDHIGKLDYDPATDSFRGWLFTIVHNKLCDFRARPPRYCQGSGDSQVHTLLNNHAAADDNGQEWEREYQRSLFVWAAERVKPQVQKATWDAFWQTAVEGKPAPEVAKRVGLSLGAVYIAKSRVMARLRAVIRELPEDE